MQAAVLESAQGIELLERQIEDLLDEDPEIGDYREGFRVYCMGKYSLGSSATTISTEGKNDHGITFYSSREHTHHVVHCEVPEQDWLEANARKVRSFGPTVVQEARGALEFLLDGSGCGNEQLEDLRQLVRADRDQDDFELVFFLIVYGRLSTCFHKYDHVFLS